MFPQLGGVPAKNSLTLSETRESGIAFPATGETPNWDIVYCMGFATFSTSRSEILPENTYRVRVKVSGHDARAHTEWRRRRYIIARRRGAGSR